MQTVCEVNMISSNSTKLFKAQRMLDLLGVNQHSAYLWFSRSASPSLQLSRTDFRQDQHFIFHRNGTLEYEGYNWCPSKGRYKKIKRINLVPTEQALNTIINNLIPLVLHQAKEIAAKRAVDGVLQSFGLENLNLGL